MIFLLCIALFSVNVWTEEHEECRYYLVLYTYYYVLVVCWFEFELTRYVYARQEYKHSEYK